MVGVILLERPEKTAVLLLLLVIVVLITGTVYLEGVGKEEFSTPYREGLPDGTLVKYSGAVSSSFVTTGGHTLLEVSGVSVFVPASGGVLPVMAPGTRVHLLGNIQHYKGKEEILVDDSSDIQITSEYQETDQHF